VHRTNHRHHDDCWSRFWRVWLKKLCSSGSFRSRFHISERWPIYSWWNTRTATRQIWSITRSTLNPNLRFSITGDLVKPTRPTIYVVWTTPSTSSRAGRLGGTWHHLKDGQLHSISIRQTTLLAIIRNAPSVGLRCTRCNSIALLLNLMMYQSRLAWSVAHINVRL